MENSDSRNKRNDSKSYYNTIFGDLCGQGDLSTGKMQLIAFAAYYKMSNTMNRAQLLEEICNLVPSPHNIFQDEEGYFCRFELDTYVPVETDEQEEELKIATRRFVENDSKLKGEFQYLEIGRWENTVVGGYCNG